MWTVASQKRGEEYEASWELYFLSSQKKMAFLGTISGVSTMMGFALGWRYILWGLDI